MLDTTKLREGDKCLYKGKTLIYERSKSLGTNTYHVFHTLLGTEKKLSQPVAQRDVWLDVTPVLQMSGAEPKLDRKQTEIEPK